MIIGIDNGISGGAALLDWGGYLVAWTPMPCQKSRKGNEVDVLALWRWCVDATGDKALEATYCVEEPGGAKSYKAAVSMAASFHAIRGMLSIKRVRWDRITPQSWQKSLLVGCKRGETKARASALAARLWPHEEFLATPRCRKRSEAGIDAALIGEYYRRVIQ